MLTYENLRRAPWVTIAEAASMLGVSTRTVRRWQAAGRMPKRFRRSRQLTYLREDVLSLRGKL
ncbi:helix-turn-helix domain-containing protein [Pseudaminobacter sp. 19-2017]|uniref:Helix-turn-helix domain-containing protein n=1 Tax=Pseudaminobacter soli (ex Zhang et al. 2022) TaxID=2831468 RepID=A0A942DZ30_9HYPH|nr:helix-turn-helix domain-containing protein [Pseudaminobacter soli]MBS3650038.1 helix-turn-helix domain-containing protein [Pseudaminobacter soli]